MQFSADPPNNYSFMAGRSSILCVGSLGSSSLMYPQDALQHGTS